MELLAELLKLLFGSPLGILLFLALAYLVVRAGRSLVDSSSHPPEQSIPPSDRDCPRCGAPLESASHCFVCRWPAPLPVGEQPKQVVAALLEQLDRYERLGLVRSETRRRLATSLVAAPETLITPTTPTALAPVVTTPPTSDFVTASVVEEPAAPATSIPGPAVAVPTAPIATTPPAPVAPAATTPPVFPSAPGREAAPPTPADRVREFMERHAASTASTSGAPTQTGPAAGPAPRREAMARLFSAFLEEKNIRWGELIGGLLIVGCSIALVISFWAEIAARPLVKFLLFNGSTAALFLMGLYTERRWKIHTTSRGVLITAILLVPLNFLAVAAFTRDTPPTDVVSLTGEGISITIFTALVFLASRIVVPTAPVLTTLGVMIPSIVQLLTRRFVTPDASWAPHYSLSALAAACYLVPTTAQVRRLWREPKIDEPAVGGLFSIVGLTTFATVLPLALLLYITGDPREWLHRLSPLGAPLGVPALIVGLLCWRKIDDRELATVQTAGLGLGFLGTLVMIAGLVLAWPEPATLLPTSVACGVIFALVALGFNLPVAYLPAGLCAAGAWVIGFHLLRGNVPWQLEDGQPMFRTLVSATTGNVLVPLVGLYLAGAYAWYRAKRLPDALWLAIAAGLVAAASLLLVVVMGFGRAGDPHEVVWALSLYAIAAVVAAIAIDRAILAWTASGLVLLAVAQAIVFRIAEHWTLDAPWVVALLTHSTLVAGGAAIGAVAAGRSRLSRARQVLGDAFPLSAVATTIAAAAISIWWWRELPYGSFAGRAAWIAAILLVLAVANGWAIAFTAFQVALGLSIALAVASHLQARDWFADSPYPWLEPWTIETVGTALSIYALAWIAIRLAMAKWWNASVAAAPLPSGPVRFGDRIGVLLNPPWPAADRVLEVALFFTLMALAIYAVLTGAAQELTLLDPARTFDVERTYEILGMSHLHASGSGAWMFLASFVAALLLGLWQRRYAAVRALALIVVAAAACAIGAGAWESEGATASALRWLLAAMAIVASVPVWFRQSVRRSLATIGIRAPRTEFLPRPLSTHARQAILALVAVPYAAMACYVASQAFSLTGIPFDVQRVFEFALALAGVSVLVGLVLFVANAGWQKATWRGHTPDMAAWPALASWLVLLVGCGPIVITVGYIVGQGLAQYPIVGPAPGTWFGDLRPEVSYGLPLAMIALALVGYAWRERSGGYAFSAAILSNVVATMVYLFRLAAIGRPLVAQAWIEVAQLNTIVTATAALVWTAVVYLYRRQTRVAAATHGATSLQDGLPWPTMLAAQVLVATGMFATTLTSAVAWLVELADAPQRLEAASSPWGWLALALVVVAVATAAWARTSWMRIDMAAALAASLAAMTALTAIRWDRGDWLAYHVLLVGVAAAASVVWAAYRFAGRERDYANRMHAGLWSMVLGTCASALAFRALGNDPAAPWWSVGGFAAMTVLALWLAWWLAMRSQVWVAAVLGCLAATVAANRLNVPHDRVYLWINAIVLGWVCGKSIFIERWRVLRTPPGPLPRVMAFHRFGAWLLIGVVGLSVATSLWDPLPATALVPWEWGVGFGAVAATIVAALVCQWDPAARFGLAALYCAGLVAVAMFLDVLGLRGQQLAWAGTLAIAAYALATSYLWSRRFEIRPITARLGVPVWSEPAAADAAASAAPSALRYAAEPGAAWIVTANVFAAAVVIVAVFAIVTSFESLSDRVVAAQAILAAAVAIGLLARGAVRSPLQYTSLVIGAIYAVALGWAWLPVDIAAPVVHRTVVAMVATAVTAVIYGFGLIKLLRGTNQWTDAAARLMPILLVATAALTLVSLSAEVAYFLDTGNVPIATPALVAVIVALALLCGAALAAAVLPGRDPLGLSEQGRAAYVYAAEGLIALAFLHVRVTMPWLFSGWFAQYWPMIVVGIAALGVGLSEFFARRRQAVLAGPIGTTGALLPILPVMGYWAVPNQVHFSLLLLTIGGLYAALAVMRRSFMFGVLAVLAANGSLWSLLARMDGMSLVEHPQLWLIPPALCVIAGAQLNRARLSEEQRTFVRYAASIVIYVSSTTDIFLQGVEDAPWLPLVLAALSIVGVFAGILMRVRAFLYLGTTFLAIAVFTIIWYAAVELQRTWIWWVSGIAAGALILLLFGIFEKKRDDVLRLVEKVRQWDA